MFPGSPAFEGFDECGCAPTGGKVSAFLTQPPVPFQPTPLPADADGVLKLAAKSLFDTFAQTAMGMMVVDRGHRIVWISDGYKRFLPALGHAEADFVGRRVEEVVPNTLMAQVIDTGQAIVVDLLTNQAGTFLVSRLPLRDEHGEVIGALGLVLLDHPETTMQPLIGKFSRLERELTEARRQLAAQRRPKHTIASFIGASPVALEVKRQARRVAQADSTVLLLGETGTGKELLAHGIHAASPRAAKPFIAVNIAAVPETLLEAEFFGVAPGAYTGADRKGRDGKFMAADGGTLLLDEIGDMPLALQSKLLRVLQEQEVEPLGSNRVQRVDVRVIAATSRDLQAMVAAGTFRADLYYRINVLPIRLPPLRERLGDLEALVDALADDIARRSGLPHKALHADALALLERHDWPGNIRELRNVLEQATLMTDDRVLMPAHFKGSALGGKVAGPPQPAQEAATRAAGTPEPEGGARLPGGAGASAAASSRAAMPAAAADPVAAIAALGAAWLPAAVKPLPQAVAELEARSIHDALAATAGNKLAASRLLGISRATLYEKLALYEKLGPAAPHVPHAAS